jgi:hypothetical protein
MAEAVPVRERKILVYFTALDGEADALYDRVMDAFSEVFDAFEGPELERPRLHFSAMRPVKGSRRFALRWALADLWNALKRGEVP